MSEPPSAADTRADDDLLAELTDEFLRRHRAGEHPTVDKYAHKYPHLADRIRDLFPAVMVMEQPSLAATLDPAPPAERIGAMVGRYKLLERIGEGGFGVVFMAEQQFPVRRKVALKVIKPGVDTRQVIARFEAERQALAMMEHENIAKVLDAGATETGRPYFVMELVRGVPITQYCDDNKLPPRARLELFVQVCRAVQHAHTKGIIHRDIKPTNVLVTMHDAAPVPKVIDFGVAKATGQQQLTELTLFTNFAQMLGTPLYMSPEQAEMSGLDVDTRADVYSLGVMLYELLTGTTPFDKERLKQATVDEVRRIIREEDPPRPSTRINTLGEQLATVSARCRTDPRRLGHLVRGELDWIVMRALEKDRNRRYETANTLARDVECYLADEPVQARPVSAGYRFRRFARRNKVVLVTGLAIACVLVVATVVSRWQAVRAQTAGRESRRLAAELALDKAQLLGESGEANLALLWLARSLRTAPAEAVDLQATIRASLGAWRGQLDSLRLVLPHDGQVVALAFGPDGDPVTATARGSDEVVVRRWGVSDASPRGDPLRLPGTSRERPCAFSPDGAFILHASRDGSIGLTDLVTGKRVWERAAAPGEDAAVTGAFISPDGKGAVVCHGVANAGEPAWIGRAQLIDMATGKPLGPPLAHALPVYSGAFHPDGRSFVTGCGTWGNATDRAAVRFWQWDGRESRAPLEQPFLAMAMAFCPDGSKLITGHWDRKAVLWDLSGSPRPPVVLPHEGPVVAASFSPDGGAILTGAFDGAVRLWNLDGTLRGPPLRQGHMVETALFGRDGRSVLASNRGGVVRLWTLARGDERVLDERRDAADFPLAVSQDGRTILTQEAQRVVVLRDAATRQPVGKPLPLQRALLMGGTSIPAGQRSACSSDRRRALTVEDDAIAKLWDVQTGALVAEIKAPDDDATIFTAAFSPGGTTVVTGNFLSKAHVWDAATGKLVRTLAHADAGPVFAVAFSPDGKVLATGSADTTARFWDAQTFEPLGVPLSHHTSVIALAFSPDGKRIVTGDADKNVQLWDLATRTRLRQFAGHRGGVNDAAFSPDGALLLTGSGDGTARLWSTPTGKPLGPPLAHAAPVVRVAFSHDGRTIHTATQDQVTRWWPMPEPMDGTVDEIDRWAEVATGMELEPNGSMQVLDAAAWERRRRALRTAEHEQGGSAGQR